MTRWVKNAFAMAALCAAAMAWAASPQAPKAAAPGAGNNAEQAARDAYENFVWALGENPAKAHLDMVLDADFTWTDFNGHTLTRAQALQQVPQPSVRGPSALQDFAVHNYLSVRTMQVHSGKDYVLRVWVKRPAGLRLLVYQEVRLMDTPPVATPGTGKTCENPCKAAPYQPKSQNERDVLSAYMALQTYTVTHDSVNWGKYVADEFAAANSNSNQTLDKRGRMEDLERSKMAGYSPMPVVQMRIFDFGNAAVLVTQHQPERGKPVHITRVWTKRAGKWMEAASYQTRIESAPAKP